MKTFLTTIKYDYLQRTRSYGFLITLCIALAVGYSFVPEPNASYSTIRIGGYTGEYNSAWFGYVTAIMTSFFLSLIGFYLINNSIANDQKTKMGQIVATTRLNNFKYLLSKVLSNFLVLLAIAFFVLVMSIIMFFSYNAGHPFELFQFIKPYTLVVFPALFLVSVLAIVFEILFGRYSILQNITFFFVISALMVFRPKNETQFALDVFGAKIVIHNMEEEVKTITGNDDISQMNIGYSVNTNYNTKTFNFQGIDFPFLFIISRVLWILIGIGLVGIIAPLFHRFNTKERLKTKKKNKLIQSDIKGINEIELSALLQPKTNFGLFTILKMELLMLIRKGKSWLWLFNLGGMIALATVPLDIAHQFVLPILWFLQVGRLSDLTSKELSHKVHYFAFTSFKPLSRLLASQLLSAIILMLTLAIPLLIRLGIEGQTTAFISLLLGGIYLVMLASIMGLLTKGKKLFEVLFFMLTYANINSIPFLDYFGAFKHTNNYVSSLLFITLIFTFLVFWLRNLQLKRL